MHWQEIHSKRLLKRTADSKGSIYRAQKFKCGRFFSVKFHINTLLFGINRRNVAIISTPRSSITSEILSNSTQPRHKKIPKHKFLNPWNWRKTTQKNVVIFAKRKWDGRCSTCYMNKGSLVLSWPRNSFNMRATENVCDAFKALFCMRVCLLLTHHLLAQWIECSKSQPKIQWAIIYVFYMHKPCSLFAPRPCALRVHSIWNSLTFHHQRTNERSERNVYHLMAHPKQSAKLSLSNSNSN